jgi:acyl carrier protein
LIYGFLRRLISRRNFTGNVREISLEGLKAFMTIKEFYGVIEEIIEAEPGSVNGSDCLVELNGWDSLSAVSFIAMADEKFDESIPASRLLQCKTVDDLAALFGEKITR